MKKLKKDKIIGVLLCGQGIDGIGGLRHIKEIGGTTIIQKVDSNVLKNLPNNALQKGHVDFVLSPQQIQERLIKLVGTRTIIAKSRSTPVEITEQPQQLVKTRQSEHPQVAQQPKDSFNIIVIGSSTGGPRILKQILTNLSLNNACIIIVQHMPRFINDSIRNSLDRLTCMNVKIASNNDILEKGTVYIAPSGFHTTLLNNRKLKIKKNDSVNFACPSIDVTMKSVKKNYKDKILGVILTGMGSDGAEGISHIKKIGGQTIAQDERTSIIYGMPKEAYRTGHVDYVYPTQMIKSQIQNLFN
jgi:two-component system chemotaxis response regulator CheB